jgi:hypothetical protein
MFTVEFESDSIVITSMDETDMYEDVQVIFGADGQDVYIRQWDETEDNHQLLYMSYQQLLDLFAAMSQTQGLYKIELQKVKQ